MATTEENETAVRQFIDRVFNQHDLNAIDEFLTADSVDHLTPPGFPSGPAGVKAFIGMYLQAFPDLHATIDDILAEGDRVVTRVTYRGTQQGELMGIPATGRPVTVQGMDIHQLRDGRLQVHWGVLDLLGMMQQLGVIPAPGAAAGG